MNPFGRLLSLRSREIIIGSGSFEFLTHSFHTSSITLPLVVAQYTLAHRRWLQYRFRKLRCSDDSLRELSTLQIVNYPEYQEVRQSTDPHMRLVPKESGRQRCKDGSIFEGLDSTPKLALGLGSILTIQ